MLPPVLYLRQVIKITLSVLLVRLGVLQCIFSVLELLQFVFCLKETVILLLPTQIFFSYVHSLPSRIPSQSTVVLFLHVIRCIF